MTNQKLQLIINGYNNLENDVETRISQKLPISSILFLIYVNKIFEQVEKELSEIVFLSFVDDLGFVASKMLIKEIARALRKVGNRVVKWGQKNAITYNTSKIKLVLFFCIR